MYAGILVFAAAHLEPDRLAQHGLERGDVAVGGPQLQFRVATGTQPCEVVVAAGIQVDPGEHL